MLKTKCKVLSIILILVLLVPSCSDVGTEINVETPAGMATLTAVPENTSTPMSLPTETKLASALFPPIKTQCGDDSPESQKLDLSGVVVLNKASTLDSPEFGLFLMNLKNGNSIRDIEEGLLAQVSPDRKHVAYEYIRDDAGFLRVLDHNGKTISDFPFRIDEKGQSFFNWQNAEKLRTIQQTRDWAILVHLLNPFVQEHTPLRTDWDGVYTPKNPFSDKLVQWKFDQRATKVNYVYGANILFDPSLTRVLYPKDNGVVLLVDVESEAELATAQFEDWGRFPTWSPDGQYLTIVNHESNADEFYLISRDGSEFQRITDFSNELGFASISDSVWSPDSEQIAFWLNTQTGHQEAGAQSELVILNVANRQVTRLCIQGISTSAVKPWLMGHTEPIWSPDGKYIMLTQWDDPTSPRKYYVFVVDPLTGVVNRISENTAPIGWMSSEP